MSSECRKKTETAMREACEISKDTTLRGWYKMIDSAQDRKWATDLAALNVIRVNSTLWCQCVWLSNLVDYRRGGHATNHRDSNPHCGTYDYLNNSPSEWFALAATNSQSGGIILTKSEADLLPQYAFYYFYDIAFVTIRQNDIFRIVVHKHQFNLPIETNIEPLEADLNWFCQAILKPKSSHCYGPVRSLINLKPLGSDECLDVPPINTQLIYTTLPDPGVIFRIEAIRRYTCDSSVIEDDEPMQPNGGRAPPPVIRPYQHRPLLPTITTTPIIPPQQTRRATRPRPEITTKRPPTYNSNNGGDVYYNMGAEIDDHDVPWVDGRGGSTVTRSQAFEWSHGIMAAAIVLLILGILGCAFKSRLRNGKQIRCRVARRRLGDALTKANNYTIDVIRTIDTLKSVRHSDERLIPTENAARALSTQYTRLLDMLGEFKHVPDNVTDELCQTSHLLGGLLSVNVPLINKYCRQPDKRTISPRSFDFADLIKRYNASIGGRQTHDDQCNINRDIWTPSEPLVNGRQQHQQPSVQLSTFNSSEHQRPTSFTPNPTVDQQPPASFSPEESRPSPPSPPLPRPPPPLAQVAAGTTGDLYYDRNAFVPTVVY